MPCRKQNVAFPRRARRFGQLVVLAFQRCVKEGNLVVQIANEENGWPLGEKTVGNLHEYVTRQGKLLEGKVFRVGEAIYFRLIRRQLLSIIAFLPSETRRKRD